MHFCGPYNGLDDIRTLGEKIRGPLELRGEDYVGAGIAAQRSGGTGTKSTLTSTLFLNEKLTSPALQGIIFMSPGVGL